MRFSIKPVLGEPITLVYTIHRRLGLIQAVVHLFHKVSAHEHFGQAASYPAIESLLSIIKRLLRIFFLLLIEIEHNVFSFLYIALFDIDHEYT